MKAYIEVPTSKELPEAGHHYLTILSSEFSQPCAVSFCYNDGFPDMVTHWLKPLPLEELMVGFARNAAEYLIKGHSMESALNEYFKLKGIQK